MRKITSLEQTHPHIASEWHPSRNGLLCPSDITAKSNKRVWWQAECGHEWDSKVYSRVDHPKCPVCLNKRVQVGVNDLATVNPRLAAEWSADNERTPSEVTYRSKHKARWVGACGHTWTATVARRVDGGGCPFCAKFGAKAWAGGNDLRTVRPDLMPEWSDKNAKSPEEVTANSAYIARWNCERGHEWSTHVYARSRGRGCPQCSGREVTLGVNDLLTTAAEVAAEWSPRNEKGAHEVHGGSKSTAWWVCGEGHEWEAPVYARVRGTGCPKCGSRGTSRAEQELVSFVSGLVRVEERNRSILGGRELDIVCPDQKVAIEFNGLYWHSEAQVSRNLHRDKSVGAERAGYQLLHIWEDDWRDRRGIVMSMIQRKLGVSNEQKVNARSTEFKKVSSQESRRFLDENHIQGFSGGSWRGGLFLGGELVALIVMKDRGSGVWELVRFATSAIVRGGHSKLLKAFIREVQPTEIVTFSDRGVSDGGLYSAQGFIRDGELPPDYSYLVGSERQHKFRYRKTRFQRDPELKYEDGATESELAALNKLLRVYDAGKVRWRWYNS